MQKQNDLNERLTHTFKNLSLLLEPVHELYRGYQARTIPWVHCAGWMISSIAVLYFKIDLFIISFTRFSGLYPYHPVFYKAYAFSISTLGFWIWAWHEVKKRKDKLKVLTHAFKNAGLQSKIGRLPNLISDFPIDPLTRKMRLTNAGFPITSFREQGKYIESELGVFIDDIKENREKRAVDIIYSHYPMPDEVPYSAAVATKGYQFSVGRTRAHTITTDLRQTPHLLVAGQTGGGKSTFLRQLIVHLHLNEKSSKFLLIDLKGGLEFSMFEQRKQFDVVPHVLAAVEKLKHVNSILEERMAFLKQEKCKDIDGYFNKKEKTGKAINLSRHIVVVDEAAEMFLAGHHAKSKEVQTAREVLSRVARQGRAVGVHLIVATQRPDSRSLDPQVKANLTGVVCFQMVNDASSIAVLGNGRATDLPKVPGRAIWKNGIEMIEVQTPFLSADSAATLLGAPDNVEDEAKAAALTTHSIQAITAQVTESLDSTKTD